MKRLGTAMAAFALAACTVVLRAQGDADVKVFEARSGDTLAITSDLGKIHVRPADVEKVRIEVRSTSAKPDGKSDPLVSAKKTGTTIFVNTRSSDRSGEAVDLYILAPKSVNITISGAGPDVDISGFTSVVHVQDSAGRITAEDLTSTASLTTDSGDIVFRADSQLQGDVRLETTSGNINCELTGNLNLRTSIRAGGRIFWDMDPVLEGASIEKSLGASGPLLTAGSLKGNVLVRLKPQLAADQALAAPAAIPARDPGTQASSSGAAQQQAQVSRVAIVQRPQLKRENDSDTAAQSSRPTGAQASPDTATASKDAAAETAGRAQPPTEGRQVQAVQGAYDLKVNVDSVYLNVSVRDRSTNRSIPGLNRNDFTVYEDGVRQEIAQMLPTEAPFNLLLLLDVSGSTQSYLHLMKTAAIDFTRQINANDKVAVATFSSNVQLVQGFTNDRTAAERAINRIKSGGGTAFYDALMTCLDSYMRDTEGRSAIVVFTDGVDNQLEGRRGAGSRTTYDQLYRRVQESDTVIYTIFLDTEGQMQQVARGPSRFPGGGGGWPGGRRRGGFPGSLPFPIPMPQPAPSPSPTPYPRRQVDEAAIYEEAARQLEEIAEQTGGRRYTPHKISELSGVYSEIADDLRVQYLLAYNPTNQIHDGRWRQIRVEVKDHPEDVARTRKGYYSRREAA